MRTILTPFIRDESGAVSLGPSGLKVSLTGTTLAVAIAAALMLGGPRILSLWDFVVSSGLANAIRAAFT